MRVLFATAELSPLVKVGGLADASAGLVKALRDAGVEVEVVVPDYQGRPQEAAEVLDVPPWVGGAVASKWTDPDAGPVTLVSSESLNRSHPYTDEHGEGWPDNDFRFMAFSAAVAALTAERRPDVLHVNDWHTGATLGFLRGPVRSVLTMHNPAHQGTTNGGWLEVLPRRPQAYEWYGGTNPLTGAIALADEVVTVSPTFAAELLRPETSFGLHWPLQARGEHFNGILNGIDTRTWDPASDPHLPVNYDTETIARKRELGRQLSAEIGWPSDGQPIIGMVTRLTWQKGVDLALAAVPSLEDLAARIILLGSGEAALAQLANTLASRHGERFAFRNGYDEGLAHLIFGGCDIFLVPSRFEPCGLTQMQAMRYGAIPVVSDVGGLHDTVIDADADAEGTGFVAERADEASLADAMGRAVRAWRNTRRRGRIRRNGMARDWSWTEPARSYIELYERIMSPR